MKKHEYSVVKTYSLTDEDIEDIVVTALNGGIGYWACLDNTMPEFSKQGDECTDMYAAKILLNGGSLSFINEAESDNICTFNCSLDLEMLLKGISEYASKYDRYGVFQNGEVDLCNLDAEGADAIFQLAMLDDIVYG